MYRIRKSVMIAGLAAAMIVLGSHGSAYAQNQSDQSDDSGPDPAAVNMAPVDGSGAGSDAGSAAQPDAQQQAAPVGQGTNEAITAAQTATPDDQPAQQPDQGAPDQNAQAPANPDNSSDQAVDQGYAAVDDSNGVDYSDASVQSDQAPPPLPDYVQPPLPGDGYIWTPGYWAWDPQIGYYWVPGAWTMPPYVGALWTPGWWGFHNGGYFFFAGYWGPYIGYYGGINYGFGYIGRGYEGGYWRDHRFQYNASVNIITIRNVSVYSHAVASPSARYSFNGPGGARLRPAPAELSAMRQPRVAPMSTQLQAQHDAQQSRGQFASVNQGRPAAIAAPRPIAADTHTQPLAPARAPQQRQQQSWQGSQQSQQPRSVQQPSHNYSRPAAQQVPQQSLQARPAPQQVPQQEQQRQFQMQPRPDQQGEFTPQRQAPAPQEQPRSAPPQQAQPRPEPQQEQRQQPQSHPESAPQSRPAPQQDSRGDDRPH